MFEITSALDQDHLAEHLSMSPHRLYFDCKLPVNQIQRHQTLQGVIDIVNDHWATHGLDFINLPHVKYWAANLVRINIYRQSLEVHGNRKPMLLSFVGDLPYPSSTGDTRLMAAEGLAGFDYTTAFISTHTRWQRRFTHLPEVKCFADFQTYAGITDGTQCWFRFNPLDAAHGLEWYEISINQPGITVPDEDWCLMALANYLAKKNATFRFSKNWIIKYRDWHAYAKQPG